MLTNDQKLKVIALFLALVEPYLVLASYFQ
jgi:hypothetical protein